MIGIVALVVFDLQRHGGAGLKPCIGRRARNRFTPPLAQSILCSKQPGRLDLEGRSASHHQPNTLRQKNQKQAAGQELRFPETLARQIIRPRGMLDREAARAFACEVDADPAKSGDVVSPEPVTVTEAAVIV